MLVVGGIVFAVLAVIFAVITLLSWSDLTRLERCKEGLYIIWLISFSLYMLTQEIWLIGFSLLLAGGVILNLFKKAKPRKK